MTLSSPPGKPADLSAAGPPPADARPSFLDWLPWEKILIWGLFLLAVYALRHFFFIIFMTFILTYIMRSIVLRVTRILSPQREPVWLERSFTVLCFALFLFGLYEAGHFLGPQLSAQGEALFSLVNRLDPEKELKNIFSKTWGTYLFRRAYSGKDDVKYQTDFQEYQQDGRLGITAYNDEFPKLQQELEDKFDIEEKRRIQGELERRGFGEKEFEEWFISKKAPQTYESDLAHYVSEWEKSYEAASRIVSGITPLDEFRKKPDFKKERDEKILHMIFEDQTRDTKKRVELRKEWKDSMVEAVLEGSKNSPETEKRFGEFYERLRKSEPRSVPCEYSKYLELVEAFARGPVAFAQALEVTGPASEEERLAQQQCRFEVEKQSELTGKWLSDSPMSKWIQSNLPEYAGGGLKSLAGWIRDAAGYLVTIPIQFVLSLLLSFFITFDMPRIRRGILRLKQSRISDFYEEIAPGLYTFGQLIGRAFQAQGVIAVFNTLLTFIAIQVIGIRNEVFLCGIVFFCSFIPVLGVVLSSIPISIMAIIQPGGNVYMALEVIGAILVIHFIETSLLNPKILGDMLHLHPVMVLAVLAIGEHFFGVWGLLLGVPVAVYIVRCVILNEEIPGLSEPSPLARTEAAAAGGSPPRGAGGLKPALRAEGEPGREGGRVKVEKK